MIPLGPGPSGGSAAAPCSRLSPECSVLAGQLQPSLLGALAWSSPCGCRFSLWETQCPGVWFPAWRHFRAVSGWCLAGESFVPWAGAGRFCQACRPSGLCLLSLSLLWGLWSLSDLWLISAFAAGGSGAASSGQGCCAGRSVCAGIVPGWIVILWALILLAARVPLRPLPSRRLHFLQEQLPCCFPLCVLAGLCSVSSAGVCTDCELGPPAPPGTPFPGAQRRLWAGGEGAEEESRCLC